MGKNSVLSCLRKNKKRPELLGRSTMVEVEEKQLGC